MTYRLNLPEKWKIHNAFHATLLSPYVETEEHGVNFIELPSDLIKGEPKWEVEKILGSRHYGQKKTLEYLIKWKGYSAVYNSWEPADNVHTSELLEEFYSEEPMAIRTAQIKLLAFLPLCPLRPCLLDDFPPPLPCLRNGLRRLPPLSLLL
jgi:hypothetical protein